MLTLRLVATEHGLLQPDAALSLGATLSASSGLLAVSPRPCATRIHVFGWSLDVDVGSCLSSFLASGNRELVAAGRDRQSLSRWLRQFGWHEAKTPRGHYDILDGHRTILSRIDKTYGSAMVLSNVDVQRALVLVTGEDLELDGVLDGRCDYAAKLADGIMGTCDRGSFSAAFRRELAIAAAEIIEVSCD
jgi:hypothetical protein